MEQDLRRAAITSKIFAGLLLGSVSILCGLGPRLLLKKLTEKNKTKVETILTYVKNFGGGVLLSTTFVHMVPEVLEEVTGLEDSPFKEHPISYAMMLICLGYFIISLTEDVGDHHHGPSKDRDETTIDPPIAMSEWSSGDGANPSSNQRRETEETVQESPDSEPNTSPLISIPIHSPGDSDNLSPSQHHATDDNVSETPNLARNLGMKAFRLVLGISIHEFFEGFAVGYAPDAASTWYLASSVAIHKFVIANWLGSEFYSMKCTLFQTAANIIFYSLVTPLGMGISMFLTGTSFGIKISQVVLQAAATGSLMYVAFIEVLAKRTGIKQLAVVILGFLLMALLQILMGHQHSHGHSHVLEHCHEHHSHH